MVISEAPSAFHSAVHLSSTHVSRGVPLPDRSHNDSIFISEMKQREDQAHMEANKGLK